MQTFSERFGNRRLLVDVFALAYGTGTWIGVSGIYVQIPLLINNAPEEWKLAAFMMMIVAVGNVGPILFGLYAKYTSREHDHLLIYGLLGAGVAGMLCMIFLYEETSYIFGAERSTAVLSCMFVAALVGCTSSVLCMPYMRNYRENYLVSYLVGEAMGNFLPSILALIQGVGGNPECVISANATTENPVFEPYYRDPRFSISVFFVILSVILFLSFVGFTALNILPVSRGERVKPPGSTSDTVPSKLEVPQANGTNSEWNMPRKTYIYLQVMIGLVCSLGSGALYGIQSYSCLPYGNVAYHLSVTLGSMAVPLAMSIGFFVKKHRVDVLSISTAGIIVLAAFISYLAVMSPAPPLQHLWVGEFIVVVAWIIVNGLTGFVKLGIITLFRPDPGNGLFYTGVASQIGSLVGSVVAFVLVDFTGIFVSYQPCEDIAIIGSA